MLLNVRRIVQGGVRPALILMAIEDISDRPAVQKELEEKSSMFDALLDSLPEVILFTDVNHVVKKVSRYAKELLKLPPERLMKADETKRIDLLEIHWPNGERLEPDELPLSKAIITGESFTDFEITVKHPDDVPKYFSIAAGPVRDDQGNIVGAVGAWRDITERKRAQESLAIERGRLRATLESIPDEMWIADKQGNIIFRSSGSIQDSLGKCDWPDVASALRELEILNSDGTRRAPEDAMLRRALRGEIMKNVPEIIRNVKTGELRWREVSGSPIRDDGRNIIGAVALARDVTERRRAEEALRESEARFKKALSIETVGVLFFNLGGYITGANATFERMSGYSSRELREIAHWKTLTTPEFWEVTVRTAENLAKLGITSPYEKQMFRKDGTRWWGLFAPTRLSGSGENTDCIEFIIDITERKRAEEALRESEEQFRAYVTASSDVVFKLDPDFRKILQLQGRDFIPDTDATNRRWLEKYIHPDDRPRMLSAIEEAIRTRSAFELEHKVIRTDGTVSWVLSRAVPLLDGNGEIREWIGAAKDVTDRKQLEQQLQEVNEELQMTVHTRTQELKKTQLLFLHSDKLSTLGKLSASIAHELNNPLQSIITILKSVKSGCHESDREMLEMALSEGNRIKKLIRNLQDLYRPSPDKKISVDLKSILDELLLLLHSDFKKKKISVDCHYAEQLPHVYAIPDQIKQVFINLLSNAAEACFEDGGAITISTRQLEAGKVSVIINDTGSGIRPENMENIFRPFFTTKGAVKGTGLGLSVSYGIVKNHGGEILVESQPGKGASFTVLLPTKETSYEKKS